MGRRIMVRSDDPLGTRATAAQSASESAALATMAGGMALGAMWPRQADAQNDPSRTQVPDNDVRQTDEPTHDAMPPVQQAGITDIPDHAGIRVAVDAQAAIEADAQIAGVTPVPDAAPIASPSADIDASARIEAEVDHDSVTLSADADVGAQDSVALASPADATTGLLSSNALLPSLFDSVAHVTDHVTGTLSGITDSVSDTLAAVTGQVTELLGPDGVVGNVTATLGETLDATQTITQDLLSGIAGIAAAPVEPLTDILGAPSIQDGLGSDVVPVPASFAPETLDASPLIDTSGFDAASPMPSETGHLTLGFLGTSYADAVDPHDLSFSPLGGGLHGLV